MPDSDRARLLPDDDDDEDSEMRSRRSASDERFSDASPQTSEDPNAVLLEVLSSQLVAAFVVAFHTRSGNIIEWSRPTDMDLNGVEFKALVSGCHNLMRDFVYFRKGRYFGLACYKQIKVDDPSERGVRMKSVGVIATSYTSLHTYMNELFDLTEGVLHNPGDFSAVSDFFARSEGSVVRSGKGDSSDITSLPKLIISHPAGCFSQMIAFFGEHILTLWKYSLLRKRIIFYTRPPIGVVCYRVYCCCFMAEHEMLSQKRLRPLPFFYVNVTDVDLLNSCSGYVACTTEKIFEHKKELFDVFVDNQNIIINSSDPEMKKIAERSSADEARFQQLNDIRMSHVYDFSNEQGSDEAEFIAYFRELNNRIFTILNDAAMSHDRSITDEHAKAMDLDPEVDKVFLSELIKLYGINVVLRLGNPCCPI